jgi:hypothetical protein
MGMEEQERQVEILAPDPEDQLLAVPQAAVPVLEMFGPEKVEGV